MADGSRSEATFVLDEWTPGLLAEVARELKRRSVVHAWEGVTLVVPEWAASDVHQILDDVERQDAVGPTPVGEDPVPSPSRASRWAGVALGVVLVLVLIAVFGPRKPSAPEPGSWAYQMCDVLQDHPAATLVGARHYDPDCLERMPWDEQMSGD